MLGKILFVFALLSSFIFVSSIAFSKISCTNCTPSKCVCSVSECSAGFFDIFKAFDCTGGPSIEIPFKNNTIEWNPNSSGNFYVRVYCDNQNQTGCTKINAAVPTSTTTTSTTTTPSRKSCPSDFECCIDEPNYLNRYCPNNEECVDNKCVRPTPEIPFNLILIVIAVLFGTLILAYVFITKKTKENPFEALKRNTDRFLSWKNIA